MFTSAQANKHRALGQGAGQTLSLMSLSTTFEVTARAMGSNAAALSREHSRGQLRQDRAGLPFPQRFESLTHANHWRVFVQNDLG
jgi:hypothetical protein